MAKKIQAIRGMNDLLPAQSPVWQYLEGSVKEMLAGYADPRTDRTVQTLYW